MMIKVLSGFLISIKYIKNLKTESMMAEHHETGVLGEELAAQFLQDLGYVLLNRNWRFRHFELDLVMKDGDQLVIAEVKTRKSLYGGDPEVSVNRQKQRTLIRAANAYVLHYGIDHPVRFDIVSVVITGKRHTINHIADAFYPMMH
jgi:putative endonuclease